MTIAHDAQTRWPATDGTSTATGDQTTTHTPSGTPAGAVVVVFGSTNANPLTGVLYGGTAMTLATSQGEATEAGWVGVYTLTENVPSGAVTVTFQGASANAKWAMVSTVTAATSQTTVNDTTVASSASGANPQVTMTTTIGTLSYGGVHSGAAAPVTTVLTGCTHQEDQDYGAKCAMAMRRTSQDAAGSPVIGYTLAADDYAICAVALGEFEPKNTAPTQVATDTSGWNATTPKATGSFTWQTGDDLYVIGMDADAPNNALGTPTVTNLSGTDLTFSVLSGFPIGGASNAEVYAWKATAGGSGSGTIQGTRSTGADDWGIRVWQFRGSDGTGTIATLIDGTHLVSLTRANHHSRIICGIADWSADADVTVDPSPASGGTVRDAIQTGGSGIATYFTADWTDQGNAGATSYGVANATGAGSKAKAAVEILGTVTSGVAGDVSATITAGSTVTAVVDRQGAVTATTTAGSTVTASVSGGALTGDITATVTAGSTVTGAVAATGAVSAITTAGSITTAVVGRLGAVSATETASSTISGTVAATGAVTATVTAGSTVTGSTVSGLLGAVTATMTSGSTVTAIVGKVGSITTTTTASIMTAAVVARTAAVDTTVTAGSITAVTVAMSTTVTATITAGSTVTSSPPISRGSVEPRTRPGPNINRRDRTGPTLVKVDKPRSTIIGG